MDPLRYVQGLFMVRTLCAHIPVAWELKIEKSLCTHDLDTYIKKASLWTELEKGFSGTTAIRTLGEHIPLTRIKSLCTLTHTTAFDTPCIQVEQDFVQAVRILRAHIALARKSVCTQLFLFLTRS